MNVVTHLSHMHIYKAFLMLNLQVTSNNRSPYLPRSSHHTMQLGPNAALQRQSSPAGCQHLGSSAVCCRVCWDAPESSSWGSAITAQCPQIATVHRNPTMSSAIPLLRGKASGKALKPQLLTYPAQTSKLWLSVPQYELVTLMQKATVHLCSFNFSSVRETAWFSRAAPPDNCSQLTVWIITD